MERLFGADTVQCIHLVPLGNGLAKMRDLKAKRFALVKKKEAILLSLNHLVCLLY
jgi:hypothetical protein